MLSKCWHERKKDEVKENETRGKKILRKQKERRWTKNKGEKERKREKNCESNREYREKGAIWKYERGV